MNGVEEKNFSMGNSLKFRKKNITVPKENERHSNQCWGGGGGGRTVERKKARGTGRWTEHPRRNDGLAPRDLFGTMALGAHHQALGCSRDLCLKGL